MIAGAYGAFVLGLSTSVGPCAAPRYLALLGAIADAGGRRRWTRAATFVAGLSCSYAAIASLGFVAASALSSSHLLYLGLAAGFCASGFAMLPVRRGCRHAAPARSRFGKPFFAGAACGLVASPCCAPIVLQGGLLAAASGSASAVASMLSAFVAGHVAPIGIAGASGSLLLNRVGTAAPLDSIQVVAGGCTIALGLYYGCAA